MAQAEKTLGVAIVGTGFGQKIHIPGFQHHHRTQVVAVHHRDLKTAENIARTHGIPKACDTLEDVLVLAEVDIVSVSTPPFLHYEMGKKVLAAGKHLLLEKPLAMTAPEVAELRDLAAEKALIATADFEFRFVPSWQLLAELLQQNFVGKKRLVKIDWIVTSRANPDRPWNWYARQDQGGGALGAVGSHAFDYIHWLFGPVKRICGLLNCAIPERPDPQDNNTLKPVTADDTCLIMMKLADGTPCQLSISSVTHHGRGHWVEVYGEDGSLVLGSSNRQDYVHGFELQGAKAGEELQAIAVPPRLQFPQTFDDGRLAPFIRVVDLMVTSIDQGENYAPSLREGFQAQQLMDLTHQSAAQGQWLEVPGI